jgi:hypothetical protein
MPAYRERLYVCPAEDGSPGWIVDFPLWWDRAAFFEKFGSRQLDTGNPFYVDHALLMSSWEAVDWDRSCREKFASDPRSTEPYFVDAMRKLESVLSAASWIIVESYEWESGLS